MSAQLALLYISLLKQDNYREIIDSINFYKLLGVEKTATKTEIEQRYKLVKEKIMPETYPKFAVYKERFQYLIDRIDKAYEDFVNGTLVFNDKEEDFKYTPISEMTEPEFRPDVYVPYTPQPPVSFISEMSVPEPTERVGPTYERDFISEAPSRDFTPEKVNIYSSNDIFTAGNDIVASFLSIPLSDVDKLSQEIIDTVMQNVLKGVMIRSPEMIKAISDTLKKYSPEKIEVIDDGKIIK